MYCLINFEQRGMKFITLLYHYKFNNSLWPIIQTNQKTYNVKTFHAPKLAKSDNGSIDLSEGLMEPNKNLSRIKPQNTNMFSCMWLSEQNVTVV
jgi:hypothetical protein